MKMIKFALLGTAALAAVTVSARANELSDLKAQIEALNARMSVAEAQTSVPAGYQLLQVGMTDAIVIPSLAIDPLAAKKVHAISVVPAADMPASTVVTWTGNVKAGITYSNYENTSFFSSSDDTFTDVRAKWGLAVVGTTETAVGEVGAKVAFAGSTQGVGYFNTAASLDQDGIWGWWKITPELTLGGGRDGSLSGNGEGFDAQEGIVWSGDYNGGYGMGDVAQLRLSYASGPIAAAIALEDGRNYDNGNNDESNFGVAGELKYSGDSFGVELNAGMRSNPSNYSEDDWTVNAGAHFALGSMATISGAVGVGSGSGSGDDYTLASLFAKVSLSDSISAQAGVSHKWNTQYSTTGSDVTAFGAGIYYSPVSQLSIGVEATYASDEFFSSTQAALTTAFSF